jgi:hypothetical protein
MEESTDNLDDSFMREQFDGSELTLGIEYRFVWDSKFLMLI